MRKIYWLEEDIISILRCALKHFSCTCADTKAVISNACKVLSGGMLN